MVSLFSILAVTLTYFSELEMVIGTVAAKALREVCGMLFFDMELNIDLTVRPPVQL